MVPHHSKSSAGRPSSDRPHRRRRVFHLAGMLMMILGLALAVVPNVLAEILVPESSEAVFIQTTGPLQVLAFGDYITNDPVDVGVGEDFDVAGAGDNGRHQMQIVIPCEPNLQYTVELFDPGVEPGTVVRDEFFDNLNNRTQDPQWFDNTHYWLYAPDGTLLAEQIYEPMTFSEVWTTFATITLPADPVLGETCGVYLLETVTGAVDPYEVGWYNDDNSWQLRVEGVGFEAELGPDGLLGTGDQADIGIFDIAYLQGDTACQDFFWFVNDGDQDMAIFNFDMDRPETYGLGHVCYFPPGVQGDCLNGYPGAPIIEGTRSGNATWNNVLSMDDQSNIRPDFTQMQTFDPAQGDFAGDAIANPAPGLWRAQLCVEADNQYLFQVSRYRVFLQPPNLPELAIEKDDGVDVVSSPGQTTYNIVVRNNGIAGALPLPDNEPEIVDTLPPGMTFVSCQVNEPLIGTCSETSPGRVEYQITGNTLVNNGAFLPGTQSGLPNEGTVTLTAAVDPGLADGTQLENIAVADCSDVFQHNFPPVSDNDIDVVSAGAVPPPPSSPTTEPGQPPAEAPAEGGQAAAAPVAGLPALAKFVTPEIAAVGETVTWTIRVTNPADTPTGSVTVTDTIPPAVELVRVSSSRGTTAVDGSSFSVNVGEVQPGEEVVITAETVAQQVLPPAQSCNQAFAGSAASNQACVTVLPAELPAFGDKPPTAAAAPLRILWQWVLGGGLLMVAGLGLMRWSARLPEA
ncbi:MAG: DUF11 domain-containing protein [Aggregatilineales bacterium]|nr:DUF11 domain-containing protein [Aggregatilineales bacterium]